MKKEHIINKEKENKILIELIGEGSSGKTTQLEKLSDLLELEKSAVVTESVRSAAMDYTDLKQVASNEEIAKDFQKKAVGIQMEGIKKGLHENDIVISDRSAWDFLIYTCIYTNDNLYINNFRKEINSFYEELLETYNITILRFRLHRQNFIEDNFRNSDIAEPERTGFNLLQSDLKIPIINIRPMDIEDTFNFIRQNIEKKLW